jgi:hypothetical protein
MKYAGFWLWEQEMNRLDLWPRMNDAFEGRMLEGAERQGQNSSWVDDMAAAQEALERDAEK